MMSCFSVNENSLKYVLNISKIILKDEFGSKMLWAVPDSACIQLPNHTESFLFIVKQQ